MPSLRNLARLGHVAMLAIACAGSLVAETTVSVTPATAILNRGGTVTVDVTVNNVANLHAAKVVVSFTNTVVQATSVSYGAFLGGSVFSRTNPAPGPTVNTMQVDQAILGPGGVTGTGVLFSFTFSGVAGGTSEITLSSVELRDNLNATIPATILPGSINVQTTHYVSESGSNTTGDGTLANPYRTIQKGIDVSAPTDIVQVLPGTYVEAVNVNKSLSLLGSGAALTTIEAPVDFETNTAYNYTLSGSGAEYRTERAIVHIGAVTPINVVMEGFTVDGKVRGPALDQAVGYSAILSEQCDVTIRANTIKNILPADVNSTWHEARIYNGRGIHIRGSGSTAIIDGNVLQEINRFYVLINATDDNSMLPAVFPHAFVSNNTLIGKGQYAGGQKGIWYNAGSWGTISGNTVSEMDYPNPSIEPERATAIAVRFGYLDPAHQRTIIDNIVSTSTNTNNKGMYIQGIGDIVEHNTITGYRWGIEVHDGHQVKLAKNTITGGWVGVLVTTEHAPGTPDEVIIGGSAGDKNIIKDQAPASEGGFAISLSFRDDQDQVDFRSSIPVDARYNDFGLSSLNAIAGRIWDRNDTTGIADPPVDIVLYDPFVGVTVANIKALLQGPSAAGSMSVALRSLPSFPLTQPYSAAPWSYTGTEAVASVPEGVVDWVLVELRTGTAASSSVATRAAFIKSDGMVMDLDGTSSVAFPSVAAGTYYVVLRHRNHLAVMSASTAALNSSSTLYDFTTAVTMAHGLLAMIGTGAGGIAPFALYSGDADGSGGVGALDRTATWNARNQTGYLPADVDLSSGVGALDRTATWNNRNLTTQVPN